MFLCIFADAIRMERAEAKRPLLAIVHGADDAIRMERAEAKAVYQFPGVLPCQDAIRMERAEAKLTGSAPRWRRWRCNPHETC